MQNNQSSGGGFFIKILIVLISIGLFTLYCQKTFPQHMRGIMPQLFQSHPSRDLGPYVLRNKYLQNSKAYNKSVIGNCQDIQVSSNKDVAYCINEKSQIYSIDISTGKVQKLGQADKGMTYGTRLSKNQSILYFVNSQLGLCQFNFKTKKVTQLASQYLGKFLSALNSIQIHPSNPNLLYITQSMTQLPMYLYNIDIMLNNPFGRLFQFNLQTGRLKLVTDGLYFANGLIFQKFKGQETILVAETNRFRLSRVYLTGDKKGEKQVAVDKLDLFLDNMKQNEKGQIWVAGPSMRNELLYFVDYHPWLRMVISRIPPAIFEYLADTKYFGGLKISFSQHNQKYDLQYYLWDSLPYFKFVTTLTEKNNKLYVSSLQSTGILVIDGLDRIKAKKVKQIKVTKKKEEL